MTNAMEEIGATRQKMQGGKPLRNSDTQWKAEQITAMLEQLFAIQDTYGKSAPQLKTLMKAMVEDLSAYENTEISEAFLTWRRTMEKIPTPAAIIKIIEGRRKHKRDMQVKDYPALAEPETPRYSDLTEEQKKQVDDCLEQVRRNLTMYSRNLTRYK